MLLTSPFPHLPSRKARFRRPLVLEQHITGKSVALCYTKQWPAVVGVTGFEPATWWLRVNCSANWATHPFILWFPNHHKVPCFSIMFVQTRMFYRTFNKLTRSQPSLNSAYLFVGRYPTRRWEVVLRRRVELLTSRLSGGCSNLLSYLSMFCANRNVLEPS